MISVAGLPAIRLSSAKDRDTTAPAPTMQRSPSETPLRMMAWAPRKTRLPIWMGLLRIGFSEPRGISCMSESQIRQPPPIMQSSPIVMLSMATMRHPERPVRFPMRSSAPAATKKLVLPAMTWALPHGAALICTSSPMIRRPPLRILTQGNPLHRTLVPSSAPRSRR